LATELTESLRRHLLWERQQKSSTANAVLKRRHTSHDVANLKQYPEKPCMKKSEDIHASHLKLNATETKMIQVVCRVPPAKRALVRVGRDPEPGVGPDDVRGYPHRRWGCIRLRRHRLVVSVGGTGGSATLPAERASPAQHSSTPLAQTDNGDVLRPAPALAKWSKVSIVPWRDFHMARSSSNAPLRLMPLCHDRFAPPARRTNNRGPVLNIDPPPTTPLQYRRIKSKFPFRKLGFDQTNHPGMRWGKLMDGMVVKPPKNLVDPNTKKFIRPDDPSTPKWAKRRAYGAYGLLLSSHSTPSFSA
ncbi:hypothetical protein FALBO_3357, partial [Fusarium albosuccineum]